MGDLSDCPIVGDNDDYRKTMFGNFSSLKILDNKDIDGNEFEYSESDVDEDVDEDIGEEGDSEDDDEDSELSEEEFEQVESDEEDDEEEEEDDDEDGGDQGPMKKVKH